MQWVVASDPERKQQRSPQHGARKPATNGGRARGRPPGHTEHRLHPSMMAGPVPLHPIEGARAALVRKDEGASSLPLWPGSPAFLGRTRSHRLRLGAPDSRPGLPQAGDRFRRHLKDKAPTDTLLFPTMYLFH